MTKTNDKGFTLIELLMTLAIAAIVLTLGIPSFQETMRSNRLTAQANDLVTALNLARAEAVKRRSPVTVCASSNQTGCTNTPWHQGWIVRVESTNEVVRVFGPMRGETTVTGGSSLVRYTQDGFLDIAAGAQDVKLTLCAGAGSAGREVAIAPAGRVASGRLETC